MSKVKIKGFNTKEQKVYDLLSDGKSHSIGELKKKFISEARTHCKNTYSDFEDHHVDSHSQSFARNSLRRLIRDGWAEKKDYGTYGLSSQGKRWVKSGKSSTASASLKRGRKPGSKSTSDPKVTEKKAKVTKKKAKVTKKAKAEVKAKAVAARKRAGKATAIDKASAAKKRASEDA